MKQKIWLVVIFFCLLGGCMQEKKVPSSGTAEKKPEATSEETTDPSGLSNEMQAWWIRRMKDHEKPEAQDKIALNTYDAYYLAEGDREKKVMYLTFDCGYENGYTEQMLDILKKHKAKAIFFVTQPYIKDQPELVKRMKKEGHLVGNHTVKHKSMPSLSDREIKEELILCAEACKEATGYEMDPYVRPPMGEYSERTLQLCKNLGYKTIFWSMAYLDYDVDNQPGADYVIRHFEENYHNGAIPLIHNVSSSNAEALDQVLTNLEKEGFRFPSLKEMSVE